MTQQTNSEAIKDEPEFRRAGSPNDAPDHVARCVVDAAAEIQSV